MSSWDHIFLALFWMYNSISVVIFHFSWKLQSDVWGTVESFRANHVTDGNFSRNSLTINGWLRDYLWSQASQVIQSYGSSNAPYGLLFLGAHFVWAFSLMFLFSGRGYWQELIESIVWAHQVLKVTPSIFPRALSITMVPTKQASKSIRPTSIGRTTYPAGPATTSQTAETDVKTINDGRSVTSRIKPTSARSYLLINK